MIIFIEQLIIHAGFLFMNVFEGLQQLSVFLFAGETKEQEDETTKEITKPSNSNEDCIPLWGLPVIHKESSSKREQEYAPTLITDEQNDFFASLIDCINESEETISELDPIETEIDFQELIENDDYILSMESWESQTEPIAVITDLAATANSKINEEQLGEQLWVIEVVGTEQEYIHVSDGSGRAWISTNSFASFGKGDILSVMVNRLTDMRVELLAVNVLQSHSSDFSMLDELYDNGFDEYNMEENRTVA